MLGGPSLAADRTGRTLSSSHTPLFCFQEEKPIRAERERGADPLPSSAEICQLLKTGARIFRVSRSLLGHFSADQCLEYSTRKNYGLNDPRRLGFERFLVDTLWVADLQVGNEA